MKQPQQEAAKTLLRKHGIMRLAELRQAGITAATMARMKQSGEVRHLARGLYQLAEAEPGLHHDLAEAAKRVPGGVVCLVSALSFHELTLEMPGKVWMAIGAKDWMPAGNGGAIQVVRYADRFLKEGIETQVIDKVSVKMFDIASTLADCFRHPRKVALTVAIEGLREALRQRKAAPAEIAEQARNRGSYATLRPYLEALANG